MAANNSTSTGKEQTKDEDKKKRSSKACDACRKAKCKCTRVPDADGSEEGPCQNCKANNVECTYLGASKKRGPPKGYIEAIENRMHRMEALLGGLLNNDDPRAQALLEELVGDIEARELLSRDLQTAAATGRNNAPVLKSWQRPTKREDSTPPLNSTASTGNNNNNNNNSGSSSGGTGSGKTPITQRGFDLSSFHERNSSSSLFSGEAATSPSFLSNAGASVSGTSNDQSNWFTEDDLLATDGTSPAFGKADGADNTMDFDRPTLPLAAGSSKEASGSFASSILNIPGSSSNGNNSAGGNAVAFSASPRNQRRRLDQTTSQLPAVASAKELAARGTSPTTASSDKGKSHSAAIFSLQSRTNIGHQVPAPATILHTGSAYYNLSSTGGLSTSPSGHSSSRSPEAMLGDGGSPASTAHGTTASSAGAAQPLEGPMSELADVVGQLSLDENKEVRYHGRSSGLYLISKSARYKDFFWRFPKAGVWPPVETATPENEREDGQTAEGSSSKNMDGVDDGSPASKVDDELITGRRTLANRQRRPLYSDTGYHKTEEEIIKKTQAWSVLPDKRTADHLMELYWIYVHPHIPLLYRSLFVRQYRNTVHGSSGSASVDNNNKPPPAQAVGGKVPTLLLLAVYALAARYSDTGGPRKEGIYWQAGEVYAAKAKEILHEDFGSSRLSTVQALLLLAYREIGTGAMAQSWIYVGMAVRMAQDLGLFRDVDKWFLPVNAFAYEEKQTRKRVWWTAIVLDKYVSAYIGRPMAIFERDYDVALPAEDEPDEHDIWRPIRPDGTDWSEPPIMDTTNDPLLAQIRNYPQGVKSNSISCFNHSATLSVLFSRIIANLYAIRVRVLGQNSNTLLAHLDSALATFYLKLPPHLQYNSASKKIPPPHVLTLHCQFFAALILLHRPFIPAQGSERSPTPFPSHSICTTAANAISNIVTLYSKTYTLRQSIPFLTYYVFSAGIMHVYNSTYDPSLAPSAKAHLIKCMRALKEMEITWGSASRQWELLLGIVDLRDVEVDIDDANEDARGRKRAADTQDSDATSQSLPQSGSGPLTIEAPPATSAGSDAFKRLPTFHTRPSFASTSAQTGQNASNSSGAAPRRTPSMNAASRRRHNSISAAGIRNREKPVDDRLASSIPTVPASTPTVPQSLPSTEFTFVSPGSSSMTLPNANLGSPPNATTSAFDFVLQHTADTKPVISPSLTSPMDLGVPTSWAPPTTNSLAPDDSQHSYNILGLSSNTTFDPSSLASSFTDIQNSMGEASSSAMNIPHGMFDLSGIASPPSGSSNTAGIQQGMDSSAYPNFSDFLLDPFWQTLTNAANSTTSGAPPLNTGLTPNTGGHYSSGGMDHIPNPSAFADMQSTAFFGVPSSADPSADDWANYLSQAMPREGEQP